jgi:hypothetical protein
VDVAVRVRNTPAAGRRVCGGAFNMLASALLYSSFILIIERVSIWASAPSKQGHDDQLCVTHPHFTVRVSRTSPALPTMITREVSRSKTVVHACAPCVYRVCRFRMEHAPQMCTLHSRRQYAPVVSTPDVHGVYRLHTDVSEPCQHRSAWKINARIGVIGGLGLPCVSTP